MDLQIAFTAALEEFISLADRCWEDIRIEYADLWENKAWNYAEKTLTAYEIACCIGGNAIFHMNNREYHARKGCFFFTDLAYHSSCHTPDIQLYYITFSTDNRQLHDSIKACFEKLASCQVQGNASSVGALFTEFIYENALLQPYRPLLLKHCFLDILISLYRSVRYPQPGKATAAISSRHERTVREVMEYLNEHYAENLELRDISRLFRLDPRYLNSLFKTVTHTTIIQYLIRLRVEKAKRLLRFTGMSITDIALDTGFCDCQYFCRMFKQLEGLTPSEFRDGN